MDNLEALKAAYDELLIEKNRLQIEYDELYVKTRTEIRRLHEVIRVMREEKNLMCPKRKEDELVSETNRTWIIPVEWTVTEKLEIVAGSLEEAIEKVRKNADAIPCGSETEYVDGTWRIAYDDGQSVKDLAEELAIYQI